MYHVLEARIRAALGTHIRQRYSQDVIVVTERPPRIEMGEVATPICFELAKRLKRAPRQIAQEIAVEMPPIEGVAHIVVRGRMLPSGGALFAAAMSRGGGDLASRAALAAYEVARKPATAALLARNHAFAQLVDAFTPEATAQFVGAIRGVAADPAAAARFVRDTTGYSFGFPSDAREE